jgi:hypothetical protein
MLEKGDHIIYIPPHAKGKISHPDSEIGFIISIEGNTAYCKFFYPDGRLRTQANSETVWIKYLQRISPVKMYLEKV